MTSISQQPTSHNPPHCKLTHFYLFNPPTKPHPSDPNERAHFWIPDSELTTTSELLDTPVSERMYIDQGEVVRVRVESDEFCDDEPGPPKVTEGVQMKREPKRPPYIVCVSELHLSLLYNYLTLLFGSIFISARLQSKVWDPWRGGMARRRLWRGMRWMKDSAYHISDIYKNESVTHILASCIFLLSGGSFDQLGKLE